MKRVTQYLMVAALAYYGAASAVWQIRNPTANRMTVFTEINSVLNFKKLDKFQGLP